MEPQGAALAASVEQEMAWPVVARVLAVRAVQAVLVGPEVQVALVERAGVMAALAPALVIQAPAIQAPAIQAVATRAGATGWVRNRADGTVEAEIEGPPEAVAAVVAWARTGPRGGWVDQLRVTERAEEGSSVFEIRRDG